MDGLARRPSGETAASVAPAGGRALPFSVALIVLVWAWSVWRHVLSGRGNPPPASVWALVGFVALKSLVVLAVVWALLRWNGETFRDLRLAWRDVAPALLRGLLVAAALFVLVNIALGSVLSGLGGPARERTLGPLFHDPRQAPLWIFAGIVGGGFTEELERAFVLTRFERAFGKVGLFVALAVDTAVFGLGHLYQGVSGAVQSAVLGLAFALVFLRRRRVADAMAAHALFDVLGIVAAYALFARR